MKVSNEEILSMETKLSLANAYAEILQIPKEDRMCNGEHGKYGCIWERILVLVDMQLGTYFRGRHDFQKEIVDQIETFTSKYPISHLTASEALNILAGLLKEEVQEYEAELAKHENNALALAGTHTP